MFMDTSLASQYASPLKGFCSYLLDVRGRSTATVYAYQHNVAGFLAYLQREGLGLTEGITSIHASMYIMELMEPRPASAAGAPPLAARTASRVVSALKSFSQYLQFDGVFEVSPLARLQSPKYARHLPVYYTVDEIMHLITARDAVQSPAGWRDAAILRVLYGTGIRVSECTGLELASVSIADGWASVLGKGGKQRFVPLGRPAAAAIQCWLELGRPRWANEHSGTALFLGQHGRRINRRRIQVVLDRAALAAGLLKPVSPHKLRHACATHLLEGGADVRTVQELLGHEQLHTTQIYTQVTRTHLRDVYLDAHPRAKLPPQ
jgi:site-specific recombinase XerD